MSEPSKKSKLMSILGLFFLSPFIGEYLLGNLPITLLWVLPIQAAMYGGGCLLIREATCRMKTIWPSRILLCIAYGIVEEVFVAQTVFNNNYFGLHLLNYGYINFLGTGAWWIIYVLSLHTIWSTSVPIALVENFNSKFKRTQWMGLIGWIITAIIYSGGCLFLSFALNKGVLHGSSTQLISSIVIIVLLIAGAIFMGKHDFKFSPGRIKPPPSYIAGCIVYIISSVFLYLSHMRDILPSNINVLCMVLLLITGGFLIWKWSKDSKWTISHNLAVITGLIITYSWYGFIQPATMPGVTLSIKYTGNIIFNLIIFLILALAWRRIRIENKTKGANHAI